MSKRIQNQGDSKSKSEMEVDASKPMKETEVPDGHKVTVEKGSPNSRTYNVIEAD